MRLSENIIRHADSQVIKIAKHISMPSNKYSSAIAETALQGWLLLAKSGRLELGDTILLTL